MKTFEQEKAIIIAEANRIGVIGYRYRCECSVFLFRVLGLELKLNFGGLGVVKSGCGGMIDKF